MPQPFPLTCRALARDRFRAAGTVLGLAGVLVVLWLAWSVRAGGPADSPASLLLRTAGLGANRR